MLPNERYRVPVLDKLRACAILLVVVYHAAQMSLVPLPEMARITQYGQYGVDLFFVLSGFLIGGLYWREMKAFKKVALLRFWARRWLRTLPPYFAALTLSWLAVAWTRKEPFDWGYLVFLQNYYERIPFFLVSWSLCVEEHFYLVAPIASVLATIFLTRQKLWFVWLLLMAASPFFRWYGAPPEPPENFGYYDTATHLRLDGLVLGFGLSYIATFAPIRFNQLAKLCIPLFVMCTVALTALAWFGGISRSALWPLIVALLCGTALIFGLSRRPSSEAQPIIPWKSLAISSYSAYLVHPIAIHVARNVTSAMPQSYWIFYWPLVITLVCLATACFYFCFERASIILRDLWVPSRSHSIARVGGN